MIAIDDTLISDELISKQFVCDLSACKGECCVAGDSGAPLLNDEVPIIESILDKVKPYIPSDGWKAIQEQGVSVIDSDGDLVTPLVDKNKHCAFVFFDENQIAKCAIEKAYLNGEIDFKKPISCHLYPVRLSYFKTYTAVNYDKWEVCKPACVCGEKLKVPVYKFLKEPLIRKFGHNWFAQLETVASELQQGN